MKPVHVVCLFATLVSMLVLAQSGRTPRANRSNGLIARPRPGVPLNSSQMPQGIPFARRKAGEFKVAGAPQASGLNFANVAAYDSGGPYATSVAVADVNGDGKPDLLVANAWACIEGCGKGSVGVLLGNGDGTFQTAVTYGSGGLEAISVAVADVNGDGKPDLLVANECAGGNCDAVAVLLGNGDGTFQTAVTYGSGGLEATYVTVADVNGDGKPDLLVANYNSNDVGVLLNNGDGTFQTAVTYSSGGSNPNSVAVTDVNRDGKLDLLVANDGSNDVGVLLGNGDGTFRTAVNYGSGGYGADSVAVAQLRGSGRPFDIVVANCGPNCAVDGNVAVLLGNGDGTFQTAVNYDSGRYDPASVAVADVNGDGKPDLAVAACGDPACRGGYVGVLLGNGDGT